MKKSDGVIVKSLYHYIYTHKYLQGASQKLLLITKEYCFFIIPNKDHLTIFHHYRF